MVTGLFMLLPLSTSPNTPPGSIRVMDTLVPSGVFFSASTQPSSTRPTSRVSKPDNSTSSPLENRRRQGAKQASTWSSSSLEKPWNRVVACRMG